jgi:hypothetical protein
MIEEMKLRNFSAATQKTYVYAVTRLTKYYGKAPDQLGKEDVRAFLVHLIVERKLSPNGLTGYCSGLRFFYNETLGWDEHKLFIPPRKKTTPLTEIFSPEEIVRLIRAARGLKQRVLLMTGRWTYPTRHRPGRVRRSDHRFHAQAPGLIRRKGKEYIHETARPHNWPAPDALRARLSTALSLRLN